MDNVTDDSALNNSLSEQSLAMNVWLNNVMRQVSFLKNIFYFLNVALFLFFLKYQ